MIQNTINIKSQSNSSFFISIEGNIGSGKSTFLKKISDLFTIPLLFEPCDLWQNINGHNLLNEFYQDTKRWAYSFQLYAFLTRIESIEKMIDTVGNNLFFAERSIFADRYVFSHVCHNENNINELEWNMYTKWFDWTLQREPVRVIPSGIIYLSTEPKTSMNRINIRGRKEENSIPFIYLEHLHQYHNEWLLKKNNVHDKIKKIPILVLNCNEDFEKDSKTWENMITSVEKFLEKNFNYDLLKKGVMYGNNTHCATSNK